MYKEENLRLALFMGAIEKEKLYFPEHPIDFKRDGSGLMIDADDLHYHDSWDWFMPVFEKFTDVIIINNQSFSEKEKYISSVWNAISVLDISAALSTLDKAILWLNGLPKSSITP